MNIKKWLSENTSVATSIFQMCRYSESWKNSGSSLNVACSFYLILEGECWLQLDGVKKGIQLMTDDVVFFFRNQPLFFHTTSSDIPESTPQRAVPSTSMLWGDLLARNETTQLLFDLMPDFIIFRAEEQESNRLRLILELLNMECHVNLSPCNITVDKLTGILMLFLVDFALSKYQLDTNIIRATQEPEMTSLFLAILKSPGCDWGVDNMAEKVGMSRSTFIRRVNTLCGGYTPHELLTRLRISSALNIMRQGKSTEAAARIVGYSTPAGFSRAFMRIMGEGPGSWYHRLLSDNSD